MNPREKRSTLEEIFIHSWWVLLFTLVCYAIYERAMIATDERIATLETQLITLQKDTSSARTLQVELREQIAAQDDPAWIELTLMRVLGLIPRDHMKVIFVGGES